jgi:hypothetical protein
MLVGFQLNRIRSALSTRLPNGNSRKKAQKAQNISQEIGKASAQPNDHEGSLSAGIPSFTFAPLRPWPT